MISIFKIALFIVVFAIFSGCTTEESGFILDGQKATTERLVDPNSAQFRNVRAQDITVSLRKVCGEVNGKNRMGGYIGFSGFLTYKIGDKWFVFFESDKGAFEVMSKDCPPIK